MFTDRAQLLIDIAKEHCSAAGRYILDVECLLAAVGGSSLAAVKLAEFIFDGNQDKLRSLLPPLKTTGKCEGSFPLSDGLKILLQEAAFLASAEGVPDKEHPGFICVSHLMAALAMSEEASALLGGFQVLHRVEAVKILASGGAGNSGYEPADLTILLKKLRNEMLEKVFGQEHAIHTFIEGLYNAEITASADTERTKPKAVFVFAGPPGVGKTYSSELASSRLGRPFKRFDMTAYSDHERHTDLVGFAPVYKGAQPGSLTGFVKKNPSCILLFDEIEKAHLNTIQLFYQILDAGRLEDKFLREDISFKDTIIIFTTNAGRNLYDNPNRSGISSANSLYHKRTILSALENEKNPTTGHPVFPPAICSRLGTGYPVMFNHLGIAELEQVCSAVMKRTGSLLEKQYMMNFSFDPLVPISLVFREGGKVDARQVKAEGEKFLKTEMFKFSSLYEKERLDEALASVDRVNIQFGGEIAEMDESIRSLFVMDEKPEVLLIAEKSFSEIIEKTAVNFNWFTASTAEEAAGIMAVKDISLVLLDLWIRDEGENRKINIDPADSLQHDFVPFSAKSLTKGRDILRSLHEKSPEAPVYLLSFQDCGISGEADNISEAEIATIRFDDRTAGDVENGLEQQTFRNIDEELFLASVREGGARGLLNLNSSLLKTGKTGAFVAGFSRNLMEIARRNYMEKRAESLARERKALAFDTSASVVKDERSLDITLRGFRLTRVVEAADAGGIVDDVSRPSTKFDDVIGATSAKESLQFIVDWLKNPKRYKALGLRPPKGILLTGPPGTGKTMLARALAGESNCAFLENSASGFVTMWVGSGPQNIRDMFQRARKYAPSIIFIDEIDAIGKTRTGVKGSGQAEETTLNALLTEMDGFGAVKSPPVIVIAATNLAEHLDPALRRRFDREIEVDKPDREGRKKYLEKALAGRTASMVTPALVERIAGQSAGMSIADLERILHEAGVAAAINLVSLDDAVLEAAFDKVRFGEEKALPDSETLMRIARHESGHALVAWFGGKPPVQISIVGRGSMGGFMERESDENKSLYTMADLEQTIREAMGGRAAEMVYYGNDGGLSSGVSGDLAHASKIARKMISDFGMSDDFGLIALGSDRMMDGPVSIRINEIASRIIKKQLSAAVSLLQENKKYLDELSNRLFDKNRLTRKEMEEILLR
ncbi:MAG: AAA family ATPase [Firmicutes bacterium]|nr:AAA family ATPase [Bacillota bacterium]